MNLEELNKAKEKGLESIYPDKTKIIVGMGSCGIASGAGEVLEAISNEVKKHNLDAVVTQTACIGFCQKGPIVHVLEPGKPRIIYGSITVEQVSEFIADLARGRIKKEWAICRIEEEDYIIENEKKKYSTYKSSKDIRQVPLYQNIPFYKKQVKIALRNCGFIDPGSIDEYIARGGYFSLHKVLTKLSPEEVIREVAKSGLRGRGGAGFPTGLKWSLTRRTSDDEKYVICNGDEGDPGAYMDRSILEGDPHSVIEGMIIGAYAIGSKEGFIYVRAEYPLAVKQLAMAIEQARNYGLLGKNIFDSGFDFTIKINKGAGAFVCGEETALIASMQGMIGRPKTRPPFPAERGLRGKPTNINNVETWANIPVIISRGADWYSQMGTTTSKGTKVFSLVGKIANTGLVEVPMGITLREIIYDIGGGILGDKKFKSVQTGGPSGGCIPDSLIDLPVDYESLTEAGSIMGSGGMVVMDEKTCMVDIAKYFLSFTENESCGKCTPCREGIKRMFQILTRISTGNGRGGDIELLEELATTVKDASLCGLGGTAPNPILSTIRYFRNEYETHIRDKKCPAGVCRELIQYVVDIDRCNGCGKCVKLCPQEAISGEKKKAHVIDETKCIKCGACYESCPFEAISTE